MQNVATSIFYARLFAGIYDALPAAFFSYLPTYPPTALFLPFSPPHTAHPVRDPLRSLCHSSFSCAPRTGALSRFARFFSFSPAALLLLPALSCIPREASLVVVALPLSLSRETDMDLLFSPRRRFFAVRRFLPCFRSPLRSSSLQLRLVSVASSSGKCVTKDNLVGTLFSLRDFFWNFGLCSFAYFFRDYFLHLFLSSFASLFFSYTSFFHDDELGKLLSNISSRWHVLISLLILIPILLTLHKLRSKSKYESKIKYVLENYLWYVEFTLAAF